MKVKHLVPITILIITFQIFSISATNAQQHELVNIISLKLSVSPINGEPYKHDGKIVMVNYKPQIGVSAHFEVLKNLDAGLYLAYSNMGHLLSYEIEMADNRVVRSSEEMVPSHALFYGINLNYHLLDLLININKTNLDCYPILNLGYVTRSWNEMDGRNVKIDPFFEYHAGMGIGYRFSSKFALFGEYTAGRLYNEGRSKLNAGLKLNF